MYSSLPLIQPPKSSLAYEYIAGVKIECVKQIFDLFPNGWITPNAAEFAASLVTITKEQLTRILQELPE